MRFLLSSLTLLFFHARAFSQDSTNIIGQDATIFRKVLNQQFSNLITGKARTSIGNYAALDIKEPEVSFAGSHISEKTGSVLTVKASGGISDGFLQFFENSTLNTKVSLDVQYNFLDLQSKSITYYNESYHDYITKREQIRNKFQPRILAADLEQGKTLLRLKQKTLLDKERLLTLRLDSLRRIRRTEQDGLVIDSINYEIELLKIGRDSVTNAIQEYRPATTVRQRVVTARNIELDSQKLDIKVYGFNFGWWSVGYKVQNDAFRLFDSKLAAGSQLEKRSFVSQELRVQYARYNWSTMPSETYYWSVGSAFSYGHNLGELTKTEITDVTNYTAIPNQRTSTDKYNVYSGTYLNNLKGLRFYTDAYWFFLKDNFFALHAYPELKIRDSFRPTYNFGIGTLFSFKDEKDETARVNAEVYYNFIDLFDYTDTEAKFFERNDVGIRFSFPIKFKNK